ncbi:2-dehydro-3-deoxygalactonokinase [Shimia sp. SDUM112013]|uniref:2-dehydro-3-deoxygalactonokinase n=1 Tax=Shimia sp. SDUM112013 TaxID=3136160 RepID=UPI0032EFE702
MSHWTLAERRKSGIALWDMPGRQPVADPGGPIVMVGGGGQGRNLPCKAVPEALLPGEGGGWLFPPLTWDGQNSDGAEAAIAGYATAHPNWDGVLCILGDSTVWAHVSAGEVISFQRFVTAQLAAALEVSADWDEARQRAALADAMARPERLAAYIARAGDAGTLWGALLGAELAAARPYWLGQQVVVVGEGRVADALESALQEQGVPVTRGDRMELMLDGVAAAVSAHGGV